MKAARPRGQIRAAWPRASKRLVVAHDGAVGVEAVDGAFGASPSYEDGTCSGTSCHGAAVGDPDVDEDSGGTNTTPTWTRVNQGEAACGACHGLPPPPPHPFPTYPCHQCHMNVDQDDMTFVRPELHVDGVVTLSLD